MYLSILIIGIMYVIRLFYSFQGHSYIPILCNKQKHRFVLFRTKRSLLYNKKAFLGSGTISNRFLVQFSTEIAI